MLDSMERDAHKELRTGYSTGACATAASLAACRALLTGKWSESVKITLPRGQTPEFKLETMESGEGWARAGVRKDAGDDPDVTHNALIICEVRKAPNGTDITFKAGEGIGIVTKAGLPVGVGEPAINPVPKRMIVAALRDVASEFGASADFEIEISVPGGADLAKKTWNPRLGILGGISILGTTGIVKPYSCAAWIASIHRGIDVARANGASHVVGSTGATSEAAAQRLYGLPDFAMLDMGDFVGGMLKYLRRNPIQQVTIAGGFAKIAKLAQGASDLHSKRSQVDFDALARIALESCDAPDHFKKIRNANTALEVLNLVGPGLAVEIAQRARINSQQMLKNRSVRVSVLVFDREGRLLADTSAVGQNDV